MDVWRLAICRRREWIQEEENGMNPYIEDSSTLDTVAIISKKISQSFGGLDALMAPIAGGEVAKQLD